MADQCIFCDIINKKIPAKIIYEDEKSLAFLDVRPTANGHTLVIPKVHVKDFASCPDDYLFSVVQTAKKVADKLTNLPKLAPWGFNYLSNQGSVAGQEVFHFHLHVIPKYARGVGFGFSVNKTDVLPVEDVWKIISESE